MKSLLQTELETEGQLQKIQKDIDLFQTYYLQSSWKTGNYYLGWPICSFNQISQFINRPFNKKINKTNIQIYEHQKLISLSSLSSSSFTKISNLTYLATKQLNCNSRPKTMRKGKRQKTKVQIKSLKHETQIPCRLQKIFIQQKQQIIKQSNIKRSQIKKLLKNSKEQEEQMNKSNENRKFKDHNDRDQLIVQQKFQKNSEESCSSIENASENSYENFNSDLKVNKKQKLCPNIMFNNNNTANVSSTLIKKSLTNENNAINKSDLTYNNSKGKNNTKLIAFSYKQEKIQFQLTADKQQQLQNEKQIF